MTESLLCRAQLAIEESRLLREQRRLMEDARDEKLSELRRSRLHSAAYRAEISANRDDAE